MIKKWFEFHRRFQENLFYRKKKPELTSFLYIKNTLVKNMPAPQKKAAAKPAAPAKKAAPKKPAKKYDEDEDEDSDDDEDVDDDDDWEDDE